MVVLGKADVDDPGDWSWDEDDVVFVPPMGFEEPDIVEETAGLGFVNVTLADVLDAGLGEVAEQPDEAAETVYDGDGPGTPATAEISVAVTFLIEETPAIAASQAVVPAPETPVSQSTKKRRHSSSSKKYEKKSSADDDDKCGRYGRRRMRRLERDHEAERALSKLLNKHQGEVDDHGDCPFISVSAFTRLFQNSDHMRLWLSFAGASEEDQERFLSWGRRPDRKKRPDECDRRSQSSRRAGGDPQKSRPGVSPSAAFSLITKKLRRQLVHGPIRLSDLAVIEEDVVLCFFARYPGGSGGTTGGTPRTSGARSIGVEDEFFYEVIAGVPSGELEEHRFVEAAEAEGRQVVAVPIAAANRPAVQAIAQYYGLTCSFWRKGTGDMYAILKNNFDDFPMPLKTLHEVAAEIKESYLAC